MWGNLTFFRSTISSVNCFNPALAFVFRQVNKYGVIARHSSTCTVFFPLRVKRRQKPSTVQPLDASETPRLSARSGKGNRKNTSFCGMTPRLINNVYTESKREVRARRRENREKHLVLFTLGPSRQFSSTPELINEPLNEREEGEQEGEREREKINIFSLNARPNQ